MKADSCIQKMADECLMGRSRVLARTLTALYETELRSHGIKASQLNLLVVVARLGPVKRIELGKVIQLDPSTLTRNLQVMLANKWIEEIDDGEDGRGMPIRASAIGRALLEAAWPAWERAQANAKRLLGTEGTLALTKTGDKMLAENFAS